jgi:hypothetical protein
MQIAPQIFREGLVKRMSTERNMFVGKKGAAGSGAFPRSLMRKSLWGGREGRQGKKWSPQTSSQFRGKVSAHGKNILDIVTGMGIFGEHEIHDVLRSLSETHVINGKKKLIIPLYENLRRAGVGMKTFVGGKSNSAGLVLGRMINDGKIVRIPAGAVDYYYLKESKNGSGREPIFIGVKSVKIEKQYDFIASWEKRENAVFGRIDKDLNKMVDKAKKKKNSMATVLSPVLKSGEF